MTPEFFQERLDQSEIKSRLVSKYFFAWSKVIRTRADTIAYIDLFCGPGIYNSGDKSTPIMLLEGAAADPWLKNNLVTYFNDKEEECVSSLRAAIKASAAASAIAIKPVFGNYEVNDDLANEFKKMNLCPTFSFVDPFGYKGLSSGLIHAVMKDWGSDTVFFFNSNRINMGINNELVRKHMEALFGVDRVEVMRKDMCAMNASERESYILESLSQELKRLGGKYVLPFVFRRESGRISHALIFVSKHVKGYNIMKDIMDKESSSHTDGVPSLCYKAATEDRQLLFALTRPIDDLKDYLLRDFKKITLSFEDIYNAHNVDKPYVERNYRTALTQLERSKKISVNPPMNERRPRNGELTYGKSVRITFP